MGRHSMHDWVPHHVRWYTLLPSVPYASPYHHFVGLILNGTYTDGFNNQPVQAHTTTDLTLIHYRHTTFKWVHIQQLVHGRVAWRTTHTILHTTDLVNSWAAVKAARYSSPALLERPVGNRFPWMHSIAINTIFNIPSMELECKQDITQLGGTVGSDGTILVGCGVL